MRLFQNGDVLFGQEVRDAQDVVGKCIFMVQQPRFVQPQFLSLLSPLAKHTLQDFLVNLLTDSGDLEQKFAREYAPQMKQDNQHDFKF